MIMSSRRLALVAAVLLGGVLLTSRLSLGLDAPPAVQRASLSSAGIEATGGPSTAASLSDDGRYVAFASDAVNLGGGDPSWRDVFVRDRMTGQTELVSFSPLGLGNRTSGGFPAWGVPRLSADGRYVVYSSDASNLVLGDDNHRSDIFIRDRQLGTTELVVDVPPDTVPDNPPDPDSVAPDLSDDARYVVFSSFSSDLVPDDVNGTWDVFLVDRETPGVEHISQATDGTHAEGSSGYFGAGPPRISGDGCFVVFGSVARDLVEGDDQSFDDIFLRDRCAMSPTTEIVSLTDGGEFGNDHSTYGDLSDDGRYVVFSSIATNLVAGDDNGCSDIFLRDRQLASTVRITEPPPGQGPCDSRFPSISDDGAYVVFQSDASTLVAGDTNGARDIFRYSLATEEIERISVPAAGGEAHGTSEQASISADGSVVAFQSSAPDLVAGDINGLVDVFAWGKVLFELPTPTNTPPATATPPPSATPTPDALPCSQRGDVNGDGLTNSLDALFILQFVAGQLGSVPRPLAADVNHDGEITAVDAALILQYNAGLIGCLPD